jgi:YD repeat-containing protein
MTEQPIRSRAAGQRGIREQRKPAAWRARDPPCRGRRRDARTGSEALPNRPPVITSAPPTRVGVGAEYAYQATASDADEDAVTFAKLEGPQGLAVSPEGLVTWSFALPPGALVGLQAVDGNGGEAEQHYQLAVGQRPPNPNAPIIFGVPGTLAVVGEPYVYQPVAGDPDPGDVLTFSLLERPSGVQVDPASGRVTWTPTSGQGGQSHDLKLRVDDRPDGSGNFATQKWSVEVLEDAPNLSPVIVSVPSRVAVVEKPYGYQVEADDPDENQTLTFSLIEPPDGMTIEPDSGLLSWTPADPGEYTVAIRVTDDGVPAKSGSQVYRLTVSPPNLAPRITSQPPREALVGVTYRYRVEAQDPNGHDVLFALTAAPQGMWIDANTGVITWEPTPQQAEDPNEHAVAVLADDRFGGTDTQEYVVTVRTDREPPVVQIVARPNPGMIDQLVEVCVQATDNGKVIRRALMVADEEVDLDDAGCYIFTPEEIGIIPMVATAMDGAENVGESSLSYQVVDPYDPTAPEVQLHGPAPESVLTEPTPVIATITDNTPETLVWELRLIRNNTAPTIVLARGEGEVENAEIAVLDPTVLPNDPYALWLFADDGVHQVSTGYFVNIEGEFKPGRFTMTFTDMTVPVAGFPLSIERRYDSFEATVGDFGPGWRLDFPGDVKDDAEEYPTFQALRAGSKVFVTRPDGRRVGFLAFAEPIHPLFSFIVRLSFIPEADVTDELEVVGAADAYFNFSGYLYEGFTNPFNPSTYRLRLRSGIEYVIDEETGLKSIKDVNGNLITVSPEGLLSSTGLGIRTVRDGEGRIIRAIEPDDDPNDETPPGEVAYEYDADTGNLVAVVDQGNNRTTYRYDEPRRPRYLTEIIDPLGRRGIRNEYSADGRLMKTIDANGREITYNYELGDRQEEIVDRNGARVVLNYDERGNVLLRTDDLGNQTRYDYNEDNRLTRQVDCFEGGDEQEKLFAYNERGDQQDTKPVMSRTTTSPAGAIATPRGRLRRGWCLSRLAKRAVRCGVRACGVNGPRGAAGS